MDNNAVVMNALLAKLYRTFTAPDVVTGVDNLQRASFFSFASPGIPVSQASFDFLKLANLGQLNAASALSQLVNNIPNPTGFWSTSNSVVWEAYRQAVDGAVVKPLQITPQEQAQLDAAYALLYESVKQVDPSTGKIVVSQIPTALLAQYYRDYSTYNNALKAYNTKLIYVNSHPDDQDAVQDWALNAQTYASDVELAANIWGTSKGRVENAQATIAQITERGASVYFQQLKNTLRLMSRHDGLGAEFFPTIYYPDEFWSSNSWSNFTFAENEVHTYSSDTSTSWGGGTGGGWGMWSWGASVSHGESDHFDSSDTSDLSIAVELIQIPLLRPWMDAGLFKNTSWRFSDPAQFISNGLAPPATTGLLPMYPTSIIVARNLKARLNMTSTQNKSHKTEDHVGGSVGWGPFSLRGNYDRVSSTNQHDYKSTDSGIECTGMQIIGFVCNLVPKCPVWNPAFLGEALSVGAPMEIDPVQFNAFQ